MAPNEKGTITIEMAHELVDQLSKRAHRQGAQRVVIIQSAQRMTSAAQNALLKLIEEPPADTILLLIMDNKESVLRTIASRCQVVYVRPVTDTQIAEYGYAEITEIARGRAGLVMDVVKQPELKEVYGEVMDQAKQILAANPFERLAIVDSLASHKHKDEIIESLANEVSRTARTENDTSQSLQSMQNYFIYSNAGVASKHALTEMMIRL
jgi:DNA polymerase-3 subunit delta'